MEKIYHPLIKNHTNMCDFINKFKHEFSTMKIPKNTNDLKDIMDMNGDNKEFERLLASISIDSNISTVKDVLEYDFDPSIPKLQKPSVEFQKEALQLNKVKEHLDELKSNAFRRSKYKKYNYRVVAKPITTQEPDLDVNDDVILTIKFYEPFSYVSGQNLSMKFRQEFNVLGSNYLSELRDKIKCQCNYAPYNDISENPHEELNTKINYNGFFFITDTFYNDYRNEKPQNYSNVIIKWAKTKPDIKDLKMDDMCKVKFKDLNFKIAYPQVYQHGGNCEHVFAITSVRFISSGDHRIRSDYPLPTKIATSRVKLCAVCGTLAATIVVRKCSYHIHDPTFLCKTCFLSYHYIDDEKVGSFEAFHYSGNLMKLNYN